MPKVNWRKPCAKCGRDKADYDYYKYKNGEAMEICKQCLTMQVDNWNPDTFMWILQKLDLPWIESKWNELRDKQCEKAGAAGLKGDSVLGHYISTMKLKQWKDYGFDDTGKLKAEVEEQQARAKEIQEQMKESMDQQIKDMEENYKNGKITKEAFDNFVNTYSSVGGSDNIDGGGYQVKYTENPVDPLAAMKDKKGAKGIGMMIGQNLHEDIQDDDIDSQVSMDDKKYLYNKWGGEFTTQDWLWMEDKYNEYLDGLDSDSLDVGRKETIVAICKTLRRMNQAINIQDIDGYQKLSKVFNDLSKAAKLQEAQKKEKTTKNYFDNLGEFIALCEKEGGPIPDYDESKLYNKDKIDKVINDIKNHTTNLIKNELGLGNLIEGYIEKQNTAKQEDELAGLDAAIDGKNFEGLSNAEIIERLEQTGKEKAEDDDLEKEFGFKMDDNGNVEQIEEKEEGNE